MKHLIDLSSLINVMPAQLISYLKAKGWVKKESPFPSSSIWSVNREKRGVFEILVPMEPSFKDYKSRIADALKVLAVYEERSFYDIFHDLTNALKDVIRIRAISQNTSAGTIPLNDGVNLLESARTFKEIKPIEQFELHGVVVLLRRKKSESSGEISVFGLLADGQQRKVAVKLSKNDYELAIKAHKDAIPIRCVGELRRQGNVFSLFNPKNFELAEF